MLGRLMWSALPLGSGVAGTVPPSFSSSHCSTFRMVCSVASTCFFLWAAFVFLKSLRSIAADLVPPLLVGTI